MVYIYNILYIYNYDYTGWWFGTFFYFPFHIWDVILSIDFHIFQRGRSTTNQIILCPDTSLFSAPLVNIPYLVRWYPHRFPFEKNDMTGWVAHCFFVLLLSTPDDIIWYRDSGLPQTRWTVWLKIPTCHMPLSCFVNIPYCSHKSSANHSIFGYAMLHRSGSSLKLGILDFQSPKPPGNDWLVGPLSPDGVLWDIDQNGNKHQ